MFEPSLNSCIEKLHFHPNEGEAQGSLRYFKVGSKCTGNGLKSHDQGILDPSNVVGWLTKACISHTQEGFCALISVAVPCFDFR